MIRIYYREPAALNGEYVLYLTEKYVIIVPTDAEYITVNKLTPFTEHQVLGNPALKYMESVEKSIFVNFVIEQCEAKNTYIISKTDVIIDGIDYEEAICN